MEKILFFEKVKDAVLTRIKEEDESLEAIISEVTKQNGLVYHGLTFRGNENIQPVIYLDSFYQQYSSGEKFDEIVNKVFEIYIESRKNHNFDATMLTSFEKAKKHIVAAVMNAELNEALLQTMPHKILEDLALYYKIRFDFDGSNAGSVKVTNSLLSAWEISEDELHCVAIQNILDRDEAVCRDIFDVINNTVSEEMELDGLMQDSGMLVLSNKHTSDGAVFIDTELGQLKKVADAVGDDLLVIPSSRHDLILLKAAVADERSIDYFRGMVKEVNESNVSQEDFLSNNVYFFSRHNNELKIA